MKEKKKTEKKVFYYTDPLNDDFAGTNINEKKVDHTFKYVHKNPIWRFFAFIVYYIIAIPFVWLYERIFLRAKFVNKKALKKIKQPYFMYGNHTGFIDAFSPNLISFPKRNKILVSPDTVSIKGLRTIVEMLGAIPVPSELDGIKKFTEAIKYTHQKKCNITIYPEAHIWPYYTGVRPFKSTSFGYPVMLNAPVVAFFTAYSEPKGLFKSLRKANVTIYISEPIYPNKELPRKQAQEELRNKVYDFMTKCSEKYSTYQVIQYVQKPAEAELDETAVANN